MGLKSFIILQSKGYRPLVYLVYWPIVFWAWKTVAQVVGVQPISSGLPVWTPAVSVLALGQDTATVLPAGGGHRAKWCLCIACVKPCSCMPQDNANHHQHVNGWITESSVNTLWFSDWKSAIQSQNICYLFLLVLGWHWSPWNCRSLWSSWFPCKLTSKTKILRLLERFDEVCRMSQEIELTLLMTPTGWTWREWTFRTCWIRWTSCK